MKDKFYRMGDVFALKSTSGGRMTAVSALQTQSRSRIKQPVNAKTLRRFSMQKKTVVSVVLQIQFLTMEKTPAFVVRARLVNALNRFASMGIILTEFLVSLVRKAVRFAKVPKIVRNVCKVFSPSPFLLTVRVIHTVKKFVETEKGYLINAMMEILKIMMDAMSFAKSRKDGAAKEILSLCLFVSDFNPQ